MEKLTVKQYAEKCNCSVQNIYPKINRGTLKSEKVGNFTFVIIEDENDTANEQSEKTSNSD